MYDSGEVPFPICDFALVGPNSADLVHYSLHNWDKAATVTPTVCVHGLNGSRLLFSDLIRVVEHHYPDIPLLVLDLFGHGLSGCPNRAYSMSLFVGQLENLFVFLKIHTINIIGFSLGGAIAAGYAAKHPDKIAKLILIAPAGFVPFHDASKGRASGSEVNEEVELGGISPHIKYVKWIPSFLLAPLMKAMFKSAFTRPQPELPPAIPTHIREEHAKQNERLIWQSFVKKGTFHATISIVKNFPLFNMEKEYRAVQNTRVGQEAPVLLVWGSQDRVIPLKSCGAKIQSFFKNSYLFTVEDAGHVVLNEQPTVVVSAILSFLQSPPDFKFSNN